MPTRDQHLKQAKANEDLAELLLQSGDDNSTTWAATLIFYAALHYGRAFLAARGMTTISTHVGFESLFRRTWIRPPDPFPNYRRLKLRSESARYDCAVYTASQIRELRDRYLRPLRDAIVASLSAP